MPVNLNITFVGLPKAKGELKKIDSFLRRDAGKETTKTAFNAAGGVFEDNFASEGKYVGGWAPLEEYTQLERERLGFGAQHPILFRYGDLKAITATALAHATGSGSFSATDPQGKSINVSLNIGRAGGTAQATGSKALNQIETDRSFARPYWFTTSVVTREVRKQVIEMLAGKVDRL